MQIKKYTVSYAAIDLPHRKVKRHISVNKKKTLCNLKKDNLYLNFDLEDYNYIIPLCVTCINKLPKKIKKDIIFQIVVVKLKS